MYDRSIIRRNDHEGGASVECRSRAFKIEILSVNRDSQSCFPESSLADIVEGDEGRWVKLGSVETAKGYFTVARFIIGKTRDLV